METKYFRSFLFLLILSFKLLAQDLDYIKSQDTLYISLPQVQALHAKSLKYNYFDLSIDSNGLETQHVFTDKDTVGQLILIIARLDAAVLVEVSRKKFLRKHKKQVLNMDVIKQYRNREFFFKYLGARGFAPSTKTIYIIDEESLKRKDKKIRLRKAVLITSGYIGI